MTPAEPGSDPMATPARPPDSEPPVERVATAGPGPLGARIRDERERLGVSVRGLARQIGVSPSLVSQIERGRVMPSVGTLYAIANELGLSLDGLFGDAAAHRADRDRGSPQATPATVQRHGTQTAIGLAGGVTWERLTAGPDELDFLHVGYAVGGSSCPEDSLIRHGGREHGYVVSGRLGVRIGFDEHELGPGDSISFDSSSPHRLWAIGDEPARAIWVVLRRHGDSRAQDPG